MDTYIRELVSTNQKDGLKSLQSKNLGVKEIDWDTIYLDLSLTFLHEGNCGGSFLERMR